MLLKLSAVLAVFTAVLSAFAYQNNPVLYSPSKKNYVYAFYDHTVYEYYPQLDDELFPLASSIGHDLGAYRNHCLRVLTFTKYFLPASIEDDIPDAMDLAATAVAFLRIGLWTDKNLNYVEASKDQLERALGNSFTPDKLNIMREIVLQQHKLTDFTGLSSGAANALVNAVRKANWADTTMGLLRFDLPTSLLGTAYDTLEGAGFHRVILGIIMKLSPDIVSGVMEAGSIVKW